MPGGPRMSKRLSQAAPRLSMSIVMAGEEPLERKHESTVREFFANHMKTIVTLAMIFGTILCIVLIVMVHKWKFEGQKLDEIEACLDVAVIGAGMSGSYAAWRMRHDTGSEIHLFELTDIAGGRFRTQRFPDYDDPKLRAELGALYYFPQRHRLLSRSIHALRLTPEGYYPPNPDPPTYYFRGSHLKRTDFRAHSRYHLRAVEQDMTPDELKRFYTERYAESIHSDPLSVKFNDKTNLYEMGYWNFLNSIASREGFNFVQDGAQWKSHVTNGNAALLASLDLNTWEQHYTLAEGMDSLPRAMVGEFNNNATGHAVHYNRRLVCIEREEWRGRYCYRLMFQHTETMDGTTYNLTKSERYCAKKVVLAMSPSALKHIKFLGFGDDFPGVRDLLDTVLDPVPAMTAYLMFNESWWKGLKPDREDVITDLPMRRLRYIGSSRKRTRRDSDRGKSTGTEQGHLFMVASTDMSDVAYFDPLLRNTHGPVVRSECNLTAMALDDMKAQIAKLQGLRDPRLIPDPVRVYTQDWRDEPTENGWHMWKVGVRWDREAERLRKPFEDEDIFLVGGDLCPGQCQLWAEGALQTVESLLKEHFHETWLKPMDGIDLPPDNSVSDDTNKEETSVNY